MRKHLISIFIMILAIQGCAKSQVGSIDWQKENAKDLEIVKEYGKLLDIKNGNAKVRFNFVVEMSPEYAEIVREFSIVRVSDGYVVGRWSTENHREVRALKYETEFEDLGDFYSPDFDMSKASPRFRIDLLSESGATLYSYVK